MAVEPIGYSPPMHLAFLEEYRQDDYYQWTCCPSCCRYGIAYKGRCRRLCRCEAGDGKEGRFESRCDSLMLAYGRALTERFDRPWNSPLKQNLRPTGILG